MKTLLWPSALNLSGGPKYLMTQSIHILHSHIHSETVLSWSWASWGNARCKTVWWRLGGNTSSFQGTMHACIYMCGVTNPYYHERLTSEPGEILKDFNTDQDPTADSITSQISFF